ncbi:hypothetical protein MBLNU459_g6135t2 [Dothideomycetes sp. NU459]
MLKNPCAKDMISYEDSAFCFNHNTKRYLKERELEKVNIFYLQKEAESRTKELYLSRAVEVQPCFNRDVIRDLSDQATTSLLELGAWAEGENVEFVPSGTDATSRTQSAPQEDNDIEGQMQQAVNSGNVALIRDWAARLGTSADARDRVSRIFLSTVNDAPVDSQQVLLETNIVDINYVDVINERSCLHELAISGRLQSLTTALARGANTRATDVYGRIPLHYACMHGRVEVIQALVKYDSVSSGSQLSAGGATSVTDIVDFKDLDNFTPLVHGIVHAQFAAVQTILQLGARVDPSSESDHIPINLACQYGSVAIVDLLLQYQPQILADAEGLYPQHLVPRSGRSPQILLMLRNYGVNLDEPDKLYQWTPVFHAASEGHLACLKTLLECNVDVDALDEKNLSAMYYAAWEGHLDCLRLLEQAGHGRGVRRQQPVAATLSSILNSSAPIPMSAEVEAIPDLSLPPPIIPLRRYGHNFLDTTKTFIVISFDTQDTEAIEFYGDNKYPAARLTISSKSSDLIPRNVPLPVQDEFKVISFQIENLDTFSIDFDIYPTFGSKVIARGAASSLVFSSRYSSSGSWHLELFDPRLRAIGRISFRYQVVTPFHGIPLEISQFATYWKATSQISSQPNALITGSSLTGDYVRLFVQATKDGVPVLYPQWAIPSNLAQYGVQNDLISRLTYEQFARIGQDFGKDAKTLATLLQSPPSDLRSLSQGVATSWATLKDALDILPAQVHLDLHVLFPTKTEEEQLRLGPTGNINTFVDAMLKVVFDHASKLRGTTEGFIRSIVFTSYNANICTALNWKQPNYPVLLCNDLGSSSTVSPSALNSSGRMTTSVKEAVRIAQSNNFMGLICSSRLLELVPALVESVKVAGLVLITDVADTQSGTQIPHSAFHGGSDGLDGILEDNAILRFNESIDM